LRDQFQPSVECSNFSPLYDFCLVRRLPDPETERGLIVPNAAKDHERGTRRGVVEKVGPGDIVKGERYALGVKPGDIVLYDRVPANDVNLNGQMYTLCHEEQHVIAVLESA
jgi:co-chaperonin GroES (HSP10)